MAARFGVTGNKAALTAALTTALHIVGGTTARPRIFDWTLSFGGAPADNAITATIMRHSVAPTSSAVVPAADDPADPAVRSTAGENASAEGTYTAASELFDQEINQRAAYRWVAAPEGELIVPAVAAAGIGFRFLHASYTGNAKVSAHFAE